MNFNNLPMRGASPKVLGFGPDSEFDKDRYAKNYGYSTYDELKKSGNKDHLKMIEQAEEAFNKSKREIVPWMESHVATTESVHDLVAAVNSLENQIASLAKRLDNLEK